MIVVLYVLVAFCTVLTVIAGAYGIDLFRQPDPSLLQDIDAVLVFGLPLIATVTGVAGLTIAGSIRKAVRRIAEAEAQRRGKV